MWPLFCHLDKSKVRIPIIPVTFFFRKKIDRFNLIKIDHVSLKTGPGSRSLNLEGGERREGEGCYGPLHLLLLGLLAGTGTRPCHRRPWTSSRGAAGRSPKRLQAVHQTGQWANYGGRVLEKPWSSEEHSPENDRDVAKNAHGRRGVQRSRDEPRF